MPTEPFVQIAVREFRRLKWLGDGAIAQVSPQEFFAVSGPEDNSIGVIVKHIGGNLISRWTDFLTSDGEKPGRNRDGEFEIRPEDTRELLMAQWERGWATLFDELEPLSDEDLTRLVTIRGEPLTVLQAVNRQLTHYAYHVGQIVYVAKHHCGARWKTLSIPRNASAQFNRSPKPYI